MKEYTVRMITTVPNESDWSSHDYFVAEFSGSSIIKEGPVPMMILLVPAEDSAGARRVAMRRANEYQLQIQGINSDEY